MSENHSQGLRIGWASADLTPEQRVLIVGQFHARVSEGIMDPLTTTAMALESDGPDGKVGSVMVSCDFVRISDDLRDAVRKLVGEQLPELDPMHVVMNATHTHTGPTTTVKWQGGGVPRDAGVELDVMDIADYVAFAARRIADAIVRAWHNREPGGIGFGLAHATVGYNRRVCYYTAETKMYGGVDTPEFSHLEGANDTSINVLCTRDQQQKLTGVVVNLACPSQVTESLFQISADYWHETRAALRERLGSDVFILPQVSAAGDLVPAKSKRTVPDWRALERMWEREGLTQRQAIAKDITNAVAPVVEGVGRRVETNPVMAHRVETVSLTKRQITEAEVAEADAQAKPFEQTYERLKSELESSPQKRQEPRWYVDVSKAYRRMHFYQGVSERHKTQKSEPKLPTEVHVLRLGDVVWATNRFEYYLDFGLQIKARSPAIQTFVVQLAGPGNYLPTQRAASGKSYGAVPASTLVGPEGGRELADWTVNAINELW